MCTPFLFRIPGYKTDKSKTALLKAGEDWAYRLDIHGVADSPESLKDPRLKQSCLTRAGAIWSTTETKNPSYNERLGILNQKMQTFFSKHIPACQNKGKNLPLPWIKMELQMRIEICWEWQWPLN